MSRTRYRTLPEVIATGRGKGNTYHRRVRTNEAFAVLNISRVLEAFSPERRWALERLTLYFDVGAFSWRLTPSGHPIKVTSKDQYRGKRYYFVCPVSGRPASKLYIVETPSGFILGSAKGLGLTYLSQALHKTPALDSAILSWSMGVKASVAVRAMEREQERFIRGAKKFFLLNPYRLP